MRPTRGPGRPRLPARTERPVPPLALRASRRAVRAPPLSRSGWPSRRDPRSARAIRSSWSATPSSPSSCWLRWSAASPSRSASSGSRRPGPLERERIVNIPRGLGITRHRRAVAARGRDRSALGFHGRRRGAQGARRAQIRRVPVPRRRACGTSSIRSIEGKVVQHQVTIPEGLTSEQIVARLLESDILSGNCQGDPQGRDVAAGDLQVHAAARRASRSLQRMQQAQKRAAQEVVGAPLRRSADPDAGAADRAGIDHREGDWPGRRAQPSRGRLRQSAQAEDEAPVRPDDHLWPGGRQGHARPADHAQRDRAADAVQHLRDHRPASRADRQSGPRRARGRCQPVANARHLLRRRRHWRPMRLPRTTSSTSATSRVCARSSSSRRIRSSRFRTPPPHPRPPARLRRPEPRPPRPLRRRPLRTPSPRPQQGKSKSQGGSRQ